MASADNFIPLGMPPSDDAVLAQLGSLRGDIASRRRAAQAKWAAAKPMDAVTAAANAAVARPSLGQFTAQLTKKAEW